MPESDNTLARVLRPLSCSFVTAAVVLPPWTFGGIHPLFQFCLVSLIGLSAACWLPLFAANSAERQIAWWFLAPLFLVVGVCLFQLTPIPIGLLDTLSPATAELQSTLLPAVHELDVDSDSIPAVRWQAVQRISLYPAETWKQTTWFLSILTLFIVAQTTFTAKTTRWLLLVMTINGAALAFVAIATFLSSRGAPSVVWKWETTRLEFGSFLNRNHFAFYMNLCVGAAIGVWVTRYRKVSSACGKASHDGQLLLASTCLVVMLSALMICQSRGGISSLLFATACTGALFYRTATVRRVFVATGVILAALVFAFWVDQGLGESRIAAFLFGDEMIDVGRLETWQRLSRLLVKFPLFGTGVGTIPYVEPLTRTVHSVQVLKYAHNDYLQLLIELGTCGAAGIALCLIRLGKYAQEFRTAFVAGQADAVGYNVGILFAILTALLHSTVDFSMRMPGVMVAVTVLVACFIAANRRSKLKGAPIGRHRMELRCSVVALVLLVQLVSIHHFASQHAAAKRIAAYDELDKSDSRRTAELEAAVETYPNHIVWRLLLAEHYGEMEHSTRAQLKRAQHHAVTARDLCPLFAYAHADLARLANSFSVADDAEVYLQRAVRVDPTSAELWLLFGEQQLHANRPKMAIDCWRKSLAFDGARLQTVLERVAKDPAFQPADLQAVVPQDAELLYQASNMGTRATAPSRLASDFLRNAWLRDSLEAMPKLDKTVSNSSQFHLRASIAEKLGRTEQAIADYETAVALRPNQQAWRLQFAQYLVATDNVADARVQLRQLVRMSNSKQAEKLLKQLTSNAADRQEAP